MLEVDDVARDATGVDSAPWRPVARKGLRFRRECSLFGLYLVLSIALWHRLFPHLATSTLLGARKDPELFIWWFRWVPFALTHGHDPFRTTLLNAPHGVSAMWNTSVPALGFAFAPLTLLFGPVFSFNVACILGPPLSAWTCTLWLRRYVRIGPAFLGGVVFGFSPLVWGQATVGHFMMTWQFLVPLILMLVEDLLWRTPDPRWPQAVLLGVLVALQFLIGTEVLFIVAFACVGLAIVFALSDPRGFGRRLPKLVQSAALAAGVAVLLMAWPLVDLFRGGEAPHGAIRPIGKYGGSLSSLITPPPAMLLRFPHGSLGHLTPVEDGLYVGIPLLLVLGASVWLARRRRGVVIAVAAIAISVMFSMYGARFGIGALHVPAPARLLQQHAPFAENLVAPRFALIMWLSIAWLLAVAANEVLKQRPTYAPWVAVVAAAALLPLLPRPMPAAEHVPEVPKFFTTSLLDTIPDGAIALVAPMPTTANNTAMFWQVAADMRFRQVGGYAINAAPRTGESTFLPDQRKLMLLFSINPGTLQPYRGPLTPELLSAARRELRNARVQSLIVGPSADAPRHAEIAEALIGRPPDRVEGGVSLWKLQ